MSTDKNMDNKPQNSEKPKKRRWLLVAPILVLVVAVSAFWIVDKRQNDPQRLYTAAVADAVTADVAEIEQLVELTEESPLATWDDQGRVLLLSWHRYPDSYVAGEEITLSYGSVWTFTDKEISAWYQKNKAGVTDWDMRLRQLIGLPPDAGYTHVSALWAKPENVLRPAYITDIDEQMQNAFPADIDAEFKEWFEGNSAYSYEESAYPWTRLGYTYDWANNGTEYGLSEFLVEKDAPVKVEFTKTTSEFIAWLEQGAAI